MLLLLLLLLLLLRLVVLRCGERTLPGGGGGAQMDGTMRRGRARALCARALRPSARRRVPITPLHACRATPASSLPRIMHACLHAACMHARTVPWVRR